MDDFDLDEVLTIQSEYEPDINEIPDFDTSIGFRRLKRKPKRKKKCEI